MRKNYFTVLVMVVVSFLMVSCGGMKELNLKEGINVKSVCKLDLKTVDAVKEIIPSIPIGEYSYYDVNSETNVFLDLLFEIENLGSEDKLISDLVKAAFKFEDGSIYAIMIAEDKEGTDIVDASKRVLKPNEKTLVHIMCDINKDRLSKEITLIMTVDKNVYETVLNFDDYKVEKNMTKVSDTITKEGILSVKLDSVDYKNEIKPKNPVGEYSYYQNNKEGTTLLVVEATVENLKSEAMNISNALSIRVTNSEYSKYAPVFIIEKEDGSEFLEDTEAVMEPSSSNKVYLLIEMPVAAKDSEVELEISVMGDKYYLSK